MYVQVPAVNKHNTNWYITRGPLICAKGNFRKPVYIDDWFFWQNFIGYYSDMVSEFRFFTEGWRPGRVSVNSGTFCCSQASRRDYVVTSLSNNYVAVGDVPVGKGRFLQQKLCHYSYPFRVVLLYNTVGYRPRALYRVYLFIIPNPNNVYPDHQSVSIDPPCLFLQTMVDGCACRREVEELHPRGRRGRVELNHNAWWPDRSSSYADVDDHALLSTMELGNKLFEFKCSHMFDKICTV